MATLASQLDDLGFDSYADYLKSPHWRGIQRVFQRMDCGCYVCDGKPIQLHHKTYKRLGHERMDDLVPVCRIHHEELHEILLERRLSLRHSINVLQEMRGKLDPKWLKEKLRWEKRRNHLKYLERKEKELREAEYRNGKQIPPILIRACKAMGAALLLDVDVPKRLHKTVEYYIRSRNATDLMRLAVLFDVPTPKKYRRTLEKHLKRAMRSITKERWQREMGIVIPSKDPRYTGLRPGGRKAH